MKYLAAIAIVAGALMACLFFTQFLAEALFYRFKEDASAVQARDVKNVIAYLQAKYPHKTIEPKQCKGEGVQAAYPGQRFYYVDTIPHQGIASNFREENPDQLRAFVHILADGSITDVWNENTGLMPVTDEKTARVAAAGILNLHSSMTDLRQPVGVVELTVDRTADGGWHCYANNRNARMEVSFDKSGRCSNSHYESLILRC